ncbi:MAG: hypothetical protein KDB32_06650 [Planctomycetes bacterium]|nr:hypothetical protein [Planctomycetota bacterium]
MRLLAILSVLCIGALIAGCGGMPKPQIEPVKPRADATLVRVALVATNYDDSWDKEGVRLRAHQIWLNDDGVPTNKEQVFEQAYNGKQGANRGTLKMKDADGSSTSRVRLAFELVSGENKTNENISAGTTVEWNLPSSMENKDAVLVAMISRKTRNNYQIDVLYAMNPETGDLVQILPSYDAE